MNYFRLFRVMFPLLIVPGPMAAGKTVGTSQVATQLDNHELRIGRLESTVGAVSAQPGKGTLHEVQPGDTLYSIARRYGLSVDDLERANGMDDGDMLIEGRSLRLPGGQRLQPAPAPQNRYGAAGPQGAPGSAGRYKVRKGDTPYKIARMFGIGADQLLKMNGLKANAVIRDGQELKVPGRSGGSTPPPPAAHDDDAGFDAPAPATLPPGWAWHEVKRGETLDQIASRHHVERPQLAAANGVKSSADIRAGQRLKVPPSTLAHRDRHDGGDLFSTPARQNRYDDPKNRIGYPVAKGDTVESIARKFGTTPDVIRRLNDLQPREQLIVGRRIVAPKDALFN